MSDRWHMEDTECLTCAEVNAEQGQAAPSDACPKSFRPCGHHCNHYMTHDGCDWCGGEFNDEGEWVAAREPAEVSS